MPPLSRRLGELAGPERELQVEFLLHLDVFDARRAWAEEGYGSLWDYLLRVLHLREGAAFRSIAAMRVVRRLPVVAEALRDGRLCLSTVAVLGPLLTEENVGELVARAAFLTKAELERLVVTLQPRTAPKDGLRLLPSKKAQPRGTRTSVDDEPSTPAVSVGTAPPSPAALQLAPPPPRTRATLEPVTADTYSLRVTVDAALEREIEELKALLSHKIPDGDLSAVLRQAVRSSELDHLQPAALGGPSTVENIRILCRSHNALSAEQVFGRAHMDLFRGAAARTGESTSPGGSGSDRASQTVSPAIRERTPSP